MSKRMLNRYLVEYRVVVSVLARDANHALEKAYDEDLNMAYDSEPIKVKLDEEDVEQDDEEDDGYIEEYDRADLEMRGED